MDDPLPPAHSRSDRGTSTTVPTGHQHQQDADPPAHKENQVAHEQPAEQLQLEGDHQQEEVPRDHEHSAGCQQPCNSAEHADASHPSSAPSLPSGSRAVAALAALTFPDLKLAHLELLEVDVAVPYAPGFLGFRWGISVVAGISVIWQQGLSGVALCRLLALPIKLCVECASKKPELLPLLTASIAHPAYRHQMFREVPAFLELLNAAAAAGCKPQVCVAWASQHVTNTCCCSHHSSLCAWISCIPLPWQNMTLSSPQPLDLSCLLRFPA